MKTIKFNSLFVLLLLTSNLIQAQNNQPSRVGFYIAPEYSAMLLDNHVGNAVGFNVGVSLLNRKLSIGLRYVGRSGPINEHQEFPLVLSNGQTYKGKSTVNLGGDHGYFGLELAYNYNFGNDRWMLKIPFSFGQVGAGFYLKGEDRVTPDGRRVSEWEDDLQGGSDAGFGLAAELGANLYYQPFKKLSYFSVGLGAHFTKTFGYESFIGGNDFYNNKPRISLGIMIKN